MNKTIIKHPRVSLLTEAQLCRTNIWGEQNLSSVDVILYVGGALIGSKCNVFNWSRQVAHLHVRPVLFVLTCDDFVCHQNQKQSMLDRKSATSDEVMWRENTSLTVPGELEWVQWACESPPLRLIPYASNTV